MRGLLLPALGRIVGFSAIYLAFDPPRAPSFPPDWMVVGSGVDNSFASGEAYVCQGGAPFLAVSDICLQTNRVWH